MTRSKIFSALQVNHTKLGFGEEAADGPGRGSLTSTRHAHPASGLGQAPTLAHGAPRKAVGEGTVRVGLEGRPANRDQVERAEVPAEDGRVMRQKRPDLVAGPPGMSPDGVPADRGTRLDRSGAWSPPWHRRKGAVPTPPRTRW